MAASDHRQGAVCSQSVKLRDTEGKKNQSRGLGGGPCREQPEQRLRGVVSKIRLGMTWPEPSVGPVGEVSGERILKQKETRS